MPAVDLVNLRGQGEQCANVSARDVFTFGHGKELGRSGIIGLVVRMPKAVQRLTALVMPLRDGERSGL